ncbi:unnamed protein product [Absidia cylindrospora]
MEKTQMVFAHWNYRMLVSLANGHWQVSHGTLRNEQEGDHPIKDMTPEMKTRLLDLAGKCTSDAQEQALMAFFYLVMTLASPLQERTGFKIGTRSFLPVGAGLGSSASYSVVLATSLLIAFDYIPVDFASSPEKASHFETINRYAFKAEQVIHGNPSGVDNAVAAFGGAKSFLKGKGFSTLEGFQSLRLLLTNTKVPRSTNALVAGVSQRKNKYPEVIDPILTAIDGVSLRCKDAFLKHQNGTMDSNALIMELEDLVDINHCLLYALGVSHPSLEKIRRITGDYGLASKLTGAGGGGCAVTIIRDDVDQDTIANVMRLLENEGFDCYQTSVGGAGVGAVTLDATENLKWMNEVDMDILEKKFI